MVQNRGKKHNTWVTWEERGHLNQRLAMAEETWKALPKGRKSTLERDRCHKALTYFETKEALLMRKAEVVAAGTEHETHLPARRTAAKLPCEPIESSGTINRVQVDLINMRLEPSGPYKRILRMKDHWDNLLRSGPWMTRLRKRLLIISTYG